MKKLLGLGLVFLFNHCFANAIINVVPSMTNIFLRSDSETVISYTATNNTNTTLPNILVPSSIVTTGQPSLLSLQNNNCNGVTLATGAQCTFQVLIKASNNGVTQPANFSISPTVCAFNGGVCSGPPSANNVQVQINNTNSNGVFAYVGVILGTNANKLVPINASSLQLGTPSNVNYNFTVEDDWSPVAVSSDGTRVYTIEPESGNFLAFTSGANPQLLSTLQVDPFGLQDTTVNVSPDGNTIYITDAESEVYIVNNNQGTYSIGSTITGFNTTSNAVVSPDGTKLYVSDYYGTDSQGSLSIFNTSNNSLITTLNNTNGCNFAHANMIAVSPDNQTVYVGNQGTTVSVIHNNNGTYTCGTSISIGEETGGLAISPDDAYLYVIGIDHSTLYVVNLSNSTTTPYPLPTGSNAFGVAITPDASQLFITNTDSSPSPQVVYQWQLNNGIPVGTTPTATINVGGPQATIGPFVN